MMGEGVLHLKNVFEHSTLKIVLLVASQLLNYPVSFIFIIDPSTASSTNFVKSELQDSVYPLPPGVAFLYPLKHQKT